MACRLSISDSQHEETEETVNQQQNEPNETMEPNC